MEKNVFTLSRFIRPMNEFLQSEPQEHLYTVLQHVQSCHDPVFVFEKLGDSRLIGMLSAYQTLYRQSYPYTTKIQNSYIHPPDVRSNTSLYSVLEIMRNTSFYSLPVFDHKKQLLGAVKIKDILSGLFKDKIVIDYVAENLVPYPPVTIGHHALVRDLLDIFKDVDESRVLITDKEGKVSGIVTRKDLARAFIEPTSKQRFTHRSDFGQSSFDGEEKYRIDDPVSKYMSRTVYTESIGIDPKVVLQNLVNSDYNSVVLVDIMDKPLAFITIRNILDTLVNVSYKKEIPIVFKKPSDVVRESEIEEAEDILYRFIEKLSKRQNVLKVEISFEEPKYVSGKTAEFNTTLVLETGSGRRMVAHTKHKDFLLSIHEVIHEILSQEERMRQKRRTNEAKLQLLTTLAS